MTATLHRYSEILDPWAESVASRMLADVGRRNERMWRELSADIGRGLRREIESAPTGAAMRELLSEQVHLIKSIPLAAGERVHDLVVGAMTTGQRASSVAAEILRTQHVSESKARLIARTEVARANTALTQARAEYVGSEGYVWRTSRDGAVRDSHKEMEGKYVRWSQPPTLDGLTGHAGCLPNCRCFAEPVLSDDF